jgi:diguanylate cyclase (GGDEF)-like protein
MGAEATCTALVLLGLLRARKLLGLAPVFMVLGVLFHMAGFLAGTLYVRVTPTLVMSPGSVVLFPANILVVLFAYVHGDVYEARKVIYGLFAANIVTVALGGFIALHLQSSATINPFQLSPAMFVGNPRIALVGASVLFADTFLIVVLYEWLRRKLRGLSLLPIWLSTLLVLTLDTLLFVTGSFAESPAFGSILLSGLVGKCAVGSFYALLLYGYLRLFKEDLVAAPDGRPLGDVLQVLTYRERYEALRVESSRDALTNVKNRAFFEQSLSEQLARAVTRGQSLALLMIDVDHFKVINDRAGHVEGDRVLRAIAATLSGTVRGSDTVCRFGGEEFAVLLPDTSLHQAEQLAQRIVGSLPKQCRWGEDDDKHEPVTVTIGVASSVEASSGEALVRLADERLYVGKRAGRNRVVGERMLLASDSMPPSARLAPSP